MEEVSGIREIQSYVGMEFEHERQAREPQPSLLGLSR